MQEARKEWSMWHPSFMGSSHTLSSRHASENSSRRTVYNRKQHPHRSSECQHTYITWKSHLNIKKMGQQTLSLISIFASGGYGGGHRGSGRDRGGIETRVGVRSSTFYGSGRVQSRQGMSPASRSMEKRKADRFEQESPGPIVKKIRTEKTGC